MIEPGASAGEGQGCDPRLRALLLTPIKLRELTLKNRIVIAPMAMYSAVDGFTDDFHLVHLGRFALGGAGLVIAEATAVSKVGRITHGCAGLWCDDQAEPLRRIADFLHRFGCAAGLQLAHAGWKASASRPWHGGVPLNDATDGVATEPGWTPVSSTSEPFHPTGAAPTPLDESELDQVVEQYRLAARRASDIGFDVLEIHCAHGYLLHSFLSPLVNTRSDRWGGSRSGRMAFPLRIVDAVRSSMRPGMPLFVRIGSVDGRDIGWTIEDSVVFAHELKQRGVDVVDCSSGGMKLDRERQLIARNPGFHVPLAARIKAEVGIPTIAVGLIRKSDHAESILKNGEADLIALARETLWDPNWPVHAAAELAGNSAWNLWPVQFGPWLAQREKVRRTH